MVSPPTVPLAELLSTCVDACSRGCREIRQTQQKRAAAGGTLAVALKDEADARSALTEADLAAQQAIVTSLRAEWPGLTIIGEEDEEEASAEASTPTTTLPPLRRTLCQSTASDLRAPLEDVAIFVDPLDGTREFVEGRLANVQSLVGIAVRGRAIGGAIGLPFGGFDDTDAQDAPAPVVYGLVGAGVGVFGRRAAPPVGAADATSEPGGGLPIVTTGDSSNKVLASATRAALAEGGLHDVVGGVGAKLLNVVEGRADLAIMHFGSSLWDTCAPGAILAASGGKLTDLFGAPLQHLPSPPSGDLKNGLGVVGSSGAAAKRHDALCAAMRADATALELLRPYVTRAALEGKAEAAEAGGTGASVTPSSEALPAQAADVARCLDGAPLRVSELGAQLTPLIGGGSGGGDGDRGSELLGYSAAAAGAFRGMMSEGCRLQLTWADDEADTEVATAGAVKDGKVRSKRPRSVFFKRVSMGDLEHARAKALASPLKLQRDVNSYEVEARFLGSSACAELAEMAVADGGVQLARAFHVEQRPCAAPDLIESKFAMLLQDFSPEDGWRQSGMLDEKEASAALATLARFHAFFWHGADGTWRKGEEAAQELEQAVWPAGGYWQPSMQPQDQWTELDTKWQGHYKRLGAAFAEADEIAHVDLSTLGARLQRVAPTCAAEAHPFDPQAAVASVEASSYRRFRTLIHGDPKAANLFLRDIAGDGEAPEVGLIDFQWCGFGLAATDVAHHLAAALSAEACLTADGLKEATLLDRYHQALCEALAAFGVAPSAAAAAEAVLTRDELQSQYESALLDMCRLVFAYQWSRADFETESLNRNSYNKSLKSALWLVARCDALLTKRGE